MVKANVQGSGHIKPQDLAHLINKEEVKMRLYITLRFDLFEQLGAGFGR